MKLSRRGAVPAALLLLQLQRLQLLDLLRRQIDVTTELCRDGGDPAIDVLPAEDEPIG